MGTKIEWRRVSRRRTFQRGASPPDYGIDAPGVRRGMFLVGGISAAIAIALAIAAATSASGFSAGLTKWIAAAGSVIAAYGFTMGTYMTYGSRVGKLRTRDKLLDMAAERRPWSGNERVLDVGCRRGLMLIGAAQRLTTGHAVGIDLWRAEDQTDNSPAAVRDNVHREGVAGKIRIDTGDARNLPYPDASFDIVLSHWVVHNLPSAADRVRALDEMLRVLSPGGVLVLADIAHIPAYRAHFLSRGVDTLYTVTGGVETAVMGVLSGGSYRPQAIVAVR